MRVLHGRRDAFALPALGGQLATQAPAALHLIDSSSNRVGFAEHLPEATRAARLRRRNTGLQRPEEDSARREKRHRRSLKAPEKTELRTSHRSRYGASPPGRRAVAGLS